MSRNEAVKKFANVIDVEERQKLLRLVERLGIQREINAMCKLLGVVKKESDWIAWMLVGQILAQEQPEFTGKKIGRGRPPNAPLKSIDEKRALGLDSVILGVKYQTGWKPTAIEMILELDGNHPLFPYKEDIKSLQNSVSRGRRKLKKLRLPKWKVIRINNQKKR